MDLTLFAGLAMLLVWGGLTVATEAPGWVHLLLTAGVFLLVWRIIARDTPAGPTDTTGSRRTPGDRQARD